MDLGRKFRPFNATVEELIEFHGSTEAPLFRSRSQPSNLRSAYKKAELTLEDMRPFQAAAAWRLVRTHAMAKSQIGDMEPLANLGDEALWYNPMPDASLGTRTTLSKNLGDIWAGLSLMPHRGNSVEYAVAVKRATKLLDLTNNPRQPLMGSISVYGMHDAHTVVKMFPSYQEIAYHEQSFMALVAEDLITKGHIALIAQLQNEEGFSRAEAMTIVPLARNFCIQGIELDVEFDQKMMIARTEGLIKRSQEAADLRSEIQGLKHLATIQGLARVEPADPMREFALIVQELQNEDKENDRAKLAAARPVSDETGSQDNGTGVVISVNNSDAENRLRLG